MENILSLSPGQLMVALLLQVWVIIIFPAIVIRKMNYLTSLVESLYDDEEEDNADGKTNESPS